MSLPYCYSATRELKREGALLLPLTCPNLTAFNENALLVERLNMLRTDSDDHHDHHQNQFDSARIFVLISLAV